MDYSEHLPHINVKDGLSRVLNNKPLYIRLLGKFKGPELVENLAEAVRNKDCEGVSYSAHAIKGTCANLGFPIISKVAGDIEEAAKTGEDPEAFLPKLYEALEGLMGKIEILLKDAP